MLRPEREVPTRVNIHKTARTIRTVGLPSDPEPDVLTKRYKYMGPRALQIWTDYKPEFFALNAIFSDILVKRALATPAAQSFEEFSKEKREEHREHSRGGALVMNSDIFSFLRLYFSQRLEGEIPGLLMDLNKAVPENGQIDAAYKRWLKLINFRKRNLIDLTSPERVLEGGIGTATTTMTDLLEVLPKVYEGQFITDFHSNGHLYADIARNSFSLVSNLALMHVYDFSLLQDGLNRSFDPKRGYRFTGRSSQFDPDFFCITGEPGEKQALELHYYPKVRDEDFNGPRSQGHSEHSPTIGCPAMVKFDGSSAIELLWKEIVDEADWIYRTDYRKISPARYNRLTERAYDKD